MANRNYFLLIIISHLLLLPAKIHGQYAVDTTRTPHDLVEQILLGQGVLVGNVAYQGAPHAIAAFTDYAGETSIEKGIILTSGNAFYMKGPNRSSFKGWASGEAGDEDLNGITSGKTFDAAVLEFDFVTTSENLSFRYVFGSEEYQEYVGSKYNDVFAFFINGPGLSNVNLARIPGTETPITINNVNHKKNKKYYRDNDFKNIYDRFVWDARTDKVVENKYFGKTKTMPAYHLQYDGFTTLLTAQCKVIPGEIYHIKLAVADVSDGILDSGVLLQGGSFQSYGEEVVKLENPFTNDLPQAVASISTVVLSNEQPVPEPAEDMTPWFQPEIVYFEFDSHYTRQHYLQQLNMVVDWYQNNNLEIEIAGHTDSVGSHDYNLELSRMRAESVMEELVSLGMARHDIEIKFFGENKPRQSNNNEGGRAENRRVELVLKSKQPEENIMNASQKMGQLNNSSSGVVY
ncbi:MAG: choice-of-anchor L domain-containing protein [Cyclobacteriaceae bacterium]